jgi:hypothetical protein
MGLEFGSVGVSGEEYILGAAATMTRKTVKVIFFTCIVASVLVWPILSLSGFCFTQKRFMSTDEYFDAAIRQIMSQQLQPIVTRGPEGVGYKYVHPIPYRDVSDFRASNPDCCEFGSLNGGLQDGYVYFWDQIQGRAARSVHLKYTVNYLDDQGRRRSAQLEAQLVIGNCGKILNTIGR